MTCHLTTKHDKWRTWTLFFDIIKTHFQNHWSRPLWYVKLYDADHFSCIEICMCVYVNLVHCHCQHHYMLLHAKTDWNNLRKPFKSTWNRMLSPRNDMVKLHIGLLVLFIIYALHTLSSLCKICVRTVVHFWNWAKWKLNWKRDEINTHKTEGKINQGKEQDCVCANARARVLTLTL